MNIIKSAEIKYCNDVIGQDLRNNLNGCHQIDGIGHHKSLVTHCLSESIHNAIIDVEKATTVPWQILIKGKESKEKLTCCDRALLVLKGTALSLANVIYHTVAVVFSLIKFLAALIPCSRFTISKELKHMGHHLHSIFHNAIRAIPVIGFFLTKGIMIAELIIAHGASTLAQKVSTCFSCNKPENDDIILDDTEQY